MALMFSLIDEYISCIISSMPEMLSSISCTLLVMLSSIIPVHLLRYSISLTHQFVFSSLPSFNFQVLDLKIWLFFFHFLGFLQGTYWFLPIFICVFFQFFKGTFHFIFKGLCHLKVILKVAFFCFFCIGMFRSSHCRITRFCCYYIALWVVECILSLVSTHIFLQLVQAVSLPFDPILSVFSVQ